jgi:hypothetical protein
MFSPQPASPASDEWLPGNKGYLSCECPSDLTFCLAFFVLQTLLVDGYISQTFRSRAAEQYFLNLLKLTAIPTHATSPITWREGYFFFVYSVPPHVPRSLNPPARWAIDRCIVDGGTIVPQTMWSPGSPVARRLNVEKALLQMPIFFEDKNGILGLSLGASIDDGCHVLRDANDPAPLGPKTTAHIRILVSTALVDL